MVGFKLFSRFAFVAILVCVASFVGGADEDQDSVDRDYSKELPRIPATSPKEALETFAVADGFKVEQVAAEPLVEDPVAIAFDENGRLYVVEMRDYSENDKDNLGRIKLLEDTDGDGRFDKSSIFVDGLSWPTAIHCYAGGVFVGAPPNLYYFKDTNSDNQADIKQTVYTGFLRSNVQGLMNSFHWGLDCRIHLAVSSSGADIVRVAEQLEGVAGSVKSTPSKDPMVLRGRDVAFNPRTLQLTPVSGGAQHGMSFNQWGDKFVCSNSDHIQLVMYEDRYIARNPYLVPTSPRTSIAADGPQADVYRKSPVEPWRIVRTRLRMKKIVPGVVEGGGRAGGYFTGATGVTIFTGNSWSPEQVGLAFVGDVGSNIVHRKTLESKGLGMVATRVDDHSEFLASSDIWFRPVQFANAPDGNLYVLDMYREVIEHPASLPPMIKKHLDLTSGRDRGRLYRVVKNDFRQPALPKLGTASTADLVATLSHPNGWHRETALRLIFERQDRRVIPLLAKTVTEGERPEGRIHAMWALAALEAVTPDVLLKALSDRHERVREHAVRLCEIVAETSPQVREKLLSMGDDESLRVRYQLAFTLGEISDVRRINSLVAIVKRDPGNPLIRTAVLSSLGVGAGELMDRIVADDEFAKTNEGRDWLKVLSTQIGKQQRADDVALLLTVLKGVTKEKPTVMQAIVQGLAAKAGSDLEKQVAAATGGRADEIMTELLASSAKLAGNNEAKLNARVDAIQRLRLGRFSERQNLFGSLLDPTQPAEVQSAALATLATFTDPDVGKLILSKWTKLSPRLRSAAGDVLFSRPVWLTQLLDGMVAGQIAIGDVDPGRMKLLAENRDETIRAAAAKVLAKNKTGDRGAIFESYRESLSMTGESSRGKEAFKKVCAACHQLEGVGHPIGPNLAAMKNRGPEAILTNVMMPNREVNPQYMNYIVTTNDGRTFTGMIAAETATSVTLKRAENATDVILRIDIDELRSTGASLMPEGIEKQIDKQAMADIIEYLKGLE